jgi:hypothetical protein
VADASTALITGGAAILSASIALGGVYVGQLLQGRREREYRAELWRREDRHRFADHKRDLYANSLNILSKWIREVDDLAFVADIDFNQLVDEGKEPPANLLERVREDGRKDPTRYIERGYALVQQIRLVAPKEIYHGVWGVIVVAARASELLILSAKLTDAYDRIQRASKGLDKVAALMTEDLASAVGLR